MYELILCGGKEMRPAILTEYLINYTPNEILPLMSKILEKYYFIENSQLYFPNYKNIFKNIKITGNIFRIKISRNTTIIPAENLTAAENLIDNEIKEMRINFLFSGIIEKIKEICEFAKDIRPIRILKNIERLNNCQKYILVLLKYISIDSKIHIFITDNKIITQENYKEYISNLESILESENNFIRIDRDDIKLELDYGFKKSYLYYLDATFEFLTDLALTEQQIKLQEKKHHYMPILLTPASDDGEPELNICTFMGLNSKYISSGLYICKLFDYKEQCMPNEDENYSVDKSINGYKYIGNRYNNIFPFNQFPQD